MSWNVDFPWEYKHCTDDIQVKGSPGVLHAVVINHCDAGAVNVTIYDNTAGSGDVIAVIDLDIGNGKTHYVPPVTLLYDVEFKTGLYAAFSGQPSGADITVTYK